MNIRIPDTLSTMPAAVQTWPGRDPPHQFAHPADLAACWRSLVLAFVAWRIFGGADAPPMRPPPPVQVAAPSTQRCRGRRAHHRHGGRQFHGAGDRPRPGPDSCSAYFKEGQHGPQGRSAVPDRSASLSGGLRQCDGLARVRPRRRRERYARLLASRTRSRRRTPTTPRPPIWRPTGQCRSRRGSIWTTRSIRSPIDGKTGPILIQPGNHGHGGRRNRQQRERRGARPRWSRSRRSSR